jgi:hypothetical protein
MTSYAEQLQDALAAVRIHDPATFSWLGRRRRVLPSRLDPCITDAEQRRILLAGIQASLYVSFYCHGRVMHAPLGRADRPADRDLVAALAYANAGRGGWDGGWRLERLEGDVAVASRDVRIRVGNTRRRTIGNDRIEVRRPNGLQALSPGHYMALSDAPMPDGAVVRAYFNVPPVAAAALVGVVTRRLNREARAFRLKVGSHPATLARCDGAVLFLPAAPFDPQAVRELAAATPLRSRVPAFTFRVAPGTGLAEGGDDSFGMLRCGVVAEGVIRAWEQGAQHPPARLQVVRAAFEEAGIDLTAPYRDPGFQPHVL